MALGGIIAGAIGGFGAAAEDVGTRQLIEIAMKERDDRLAEMRKAEQERGFAHTEKLTERQIAATHQEGEAGRTVTREGHTLQRDLAAEQRTLTREEGRDTRQTQKDIAETHERAASARHGQSMQMQKLQLEQALKIADMSRPLQQDGEGYFFKMGTKGPEYITDASGQKFKGAKDLTARETKAADAILAQMKATAADVNMDPTSRDAAMRAYQQSLNTLLFGGGKAAAPAAPGGTPTVGSVVGGFKFKGGNPNDRSNWEPAEAVFGGEGGFRPSRSRTDVTKPAAAAPTTYRDPMSGERITAAQWRRKYGENPKEEG